MASDGNRLAAAGFADDGHDLAAIDAVGDAVDRAHGAARGLEADVQILHLEQRRARAVARQAIGQSSFHPGRAIVFVSSLSPRYNRSTGEQLPGSSARMSAMVAGRRSRAHDIKHPAARIASGAEFLTESAVHVPHDLAHLHAGEHTALVRPLASIAAPRRRRSAPAPPPSPPGIEQATGRTGRRTASASPRQRCPCAALAARQRQNANRRWAAVSTAATVRLLRRARRGASAASLLAAAISLAGVAVCLPAACLLPSHSLLRCRGAFRARFCFVLAPVRGGGAQRRTTVALARRDAHRDGASAISALRLAILMIRFERRSLHFLRRAYAQLLASGVVVPGGVNAEPPEPALRAQPRERQPRSALQDLSSYESGPSRARISRTKYEDSQTRSTKIFHIVRRILICVCARWAML